MNMWFKRDNKTGNGVLAGMGSAVKAADGKIRRRKPVVHKSTRVSSEDSSQQDNETRRHSDIMDIKASYDRRESEESVYESADGNSDAVSATMATDLTLSHATSKDSVKLAVNDEELEMKINKKGHRKTISLSTPIDIVKSLGDELFEISKREIDKSCDKNKSKESLLSEEDRDSVNGTNSKIGERNNSKKDKKKTSMEPPKSKRVGSVSALNFLRRKKKTVEPVAEKQDLTTPTRELITATATFLEAEIFYACESEVKCHHDIGDLERAHVDSEEELDAEDEESEEQSPPKPTNAVTRRKLSRTISRSKSRGKSQTVRVNTLRKSQNGTLKRAKKKKAKAASVARSRNASLADTPVPKKKLPDSRSSAYWPFSGSVKGDVRRTGSAEESAGAVDAADSSLDGNDKDDAKDGILWRPASDGGRPVNRAESCREPAASAANRRGKQRNASDPNRLTGNKQHDCEAGGAAAAGAPSGSSSNSSLSSRSAESAAPSADQLASQSDFSEEEDALAEAWSSTVAPHVVDSLDSRLRKRQELIHELITSESSHVRWLKVLQVVFLRPLERGEAGALMPAEEVRALFPNLPAVRERHTRLYGELRSLRKNEQHIVRIAPLSEAILNALGDPSYATCLSRFCRGQRMALDALRERRRKNKELHHYLVGKEQHSLCGRLQLRELVAVVWQRLTKYQLLLEGVLRTVTPEGTGGVAAEGGEGEGEVETAADVALLRRALDTAKDVLHRVDTAIRTAENQHRLKTIQSKLEVRGGSGGGSGAGGGASDTDELRRLDLTQHTLLFEGDLSIRTDTKKTTLLALMTQECLVLLQREGDKFVLKQMSQLTPIIKWSTVLFRPNAAVKNTFFLMNINGVQMYELSANSLTEYNTWTRYISEMPLAEARRAPSVLHSRDRADESSGGVSRNASDASRTSASSAVGEEAPQEPDRQADTPADAQQVPDECAKPEADAAGEPTPPPRPQLTMNGRITTHEPSPPILASAPLAAPPVSSLVAARALSAAERLRRLDGDAARALRDKSALVAELLAVPAESYDQVADLALADTLAQLDRAAVQPDARDVHQLLLAAQAQANQLTEALTRALHVSDADVVAARHYAPWREDDAGLCDTCCKRRTRDRRPPRDPSGAPSVYNDTSLLSELAGSAVEGRASCLEKEVSFDMLSELERSGGSEGGEGRPARVLLEHIGESSTDPPTPKPTTPHLTPGAGDEAWLATRLTPLACGLQGTLAALLTVLAPLETERRRLRAELATLRERTDCARHACRDGPATNESEQPPHEPRDHNAQDQTNSGG